MTGRRGINPQAVKESGHIPKLVFVRVQRVVVFEDRREGAFDEVDLETLGFVDL